MSKHWDPRQSGWGRQSDRHRWPVRRPRKRRRLRHWQGNLLMLGAVYAGIALYDFANPLLADGALPSEGSGQIDSPAAAGGTSGTGWSREAPEITLPGPRPATPSGYRSEPAARAAPAPVRVIDGDTFDYDGVRIRIADIDTPEVNGRCAYETDLAARATARLDSLLGEGAFELHPNPDGRDEDPYGRKLRIVTRGGQSLGDVLVAEGLARTWTGRREPWCV